MIKYYTCTPMTPMPQGAPGAWAHTHIREIIGEDTANTVKVQCVNCGLTWDQELPETVCAL